jgi:putative ABC transport system permease protein
VNTVSYGNWFGGVYIDEKNFFANFAVEPKSYLALYPEYRLTEDEEKTFLRDRKAFIAGRKLTERFGWRIGDTIILKGTIFPGNWEFVLRGIYKGKDKNTDESQFLFHWDYLNETLKKKTPGRADQVGFYMVGVTKPELSTQVALQIDGTFKNSVAETLTETEKAFQMSFVSLSDAIITAIRLVSYVVIVIILAVTANTMAMTSRERIGEYAVFKTLGFGGWRIAGLIFGESLVISSMGCAAGIILTFPAAKAFGKAIGSFFPVFNVEAETLLLCGAASIIVGILAAIIPTYRAIKIPIAEGLRSIG